MTIADVVEWTWTLVAVTGVVVCTWSLFDSLRDRRALQSLGENGTMRRIVQMNLRSARASLLLHAFFLLLGIAAILTVNPNVSLIYVAFAGGYILVAIFNARAIGLNQLDRVKMRRGQS